jgi:glutaredoxin-related protein
MTTVPNIWICGSFVGGAAKMDELLKAGVLSDMIAKCAAPAPGTGAH